MTKASGKRILSVNLGPDLYSRVCQLNAMYGIQKTELMRASVQLTLWIVATVAKKAGISQREALSAVVDSIPIISHEDEDVIRLDPETTALIENFFQTLIGVEEMDKKSYMEKNEKMQEVSP